jgi:hypothetical protein
MMFGWIPVVLYIFSKYPPQRAIVISFITAWLFLPVATFPLPGLPDYTKMSATCYGILIATFVFDAQRFSRFQFGWLDSLMVAWCFAPFLSSMTNGLGPYDGFSTVLDQTITWGVPYFLGRLYLSDLAGMRQLATGVFISGLIYSPFCFLENLMSPQLHRMVYGYHVRNDFSQTMRYGGFRPTVFMEHGLMVGMWMMIATLCGLWLWQAGIIKKLWGFPISAWWWWLFFIFLNARSTGAYLYFLMGILILYSAKWFRTSLLLMVLVGIIVGYLYMATTGNFSAERGDRIVTFISNTIGADRAQSIEFRFDNEEILGDKARQKFWFGWGGWGRARVYDDWGKDLAITDSLWIITFGNQGVNGLIGIFSAMMLPSLSFCFLRYPARTWSHPQIASAAVIAVFLPLFMLDCLLNAMTNPIFSLACGGLAGTVMKKPEPKRIAKPTTSARKPASISRSRVNE